MIYTVGVNASAYTHVKATYIWVLCRDYKGKALI